MTTYKERVELKLKHAKQAVEYYQSTLNELNAVQDMLSKEEEKLKEWKQSKGIEQ